MTDPLEMLTALGFGPDTVLMNDPKLFMDGRFLASLLVELNDELGAEQSALALFQIGLLHGMRDATRVCETDVEAWSENEVQPVPETTSLVMPWTLKPTEDPEAVDPAQLCLEGSWPERHEAVARCSRLGPGESPTCFLSAGYTTGWLSTALGRPLIAREVQCAAHGDEACQFEVLESDAWLESGDPQMAWLLEQVPFEAFRKIANSPRIDRDGTPPTAGNFDGEFDRSQSVVHIWGPVMVLPFTTLDEALGTVDMLGRDPGIHEIRTVVVDLRERALDEGFGAAALEQVLETVESWNAQSIVTGVGPEAEAAIASLESSHLILRKDLSEAIATAFQIADAQKHLL
ncbi:MAG: V4R domain-containing protein [Myxococcota bacterium]